MREFNLEIILSAISGISFVDNYSEVSNFYAFAYGISLDLFAMVYMRPELRRHILELYPELSEVNYDSIGDIDTWICEQKAKYGEKLLVCPVGKSLITDERFTVL